MLKPNGAPERPERGVIGLPTALATAVGLIMASPVILTVTTGFGMGGGAFAVAVLIAFVLMQAQATSFAEAASILPTTGSVYDYISCGLGRFWAITGTISAYILVHVFAGTAETILSGIMALVNFESKGLPPTYYKFTVSLKGLRLEGERAVEQLVHQFELKLGAHYPSEPPDVTWLTPIFHPNIRGQAVCHSQ